MLKDLITVGLEPLDVQLERGHEAFCALKFAVTTEEGLHKLDASILSEASPILLARAEHGGLARLQEVAKTLRKASTSFNEVLEDFTPLGVTDLCNHVLGALELARELDEQEPEFTRHLGQFVVGPEMISRPVINPFAQRVRVENRAEQQDGWFRRIPVLQ